MASLSVSTCDGEFARRLGKALRRRCNSERRLALAPSTSLTWPTSGIPIPDKQRADRCAVKFLKKPNSEFEQKGGMPIQADRLTDMLRCLPK